MNSRRKDQPVVFTASRWTAYLTASGATALLGANTAEGHIHYSGKINSVFRQTQGTIIREFALSNEAALIFQHFAISNGGYFNYALFGLNDGRFRGRPSANYWWHAGYVERLHFGELVSDGEFGLGLGFLAQASSYAGPRSQWTEQGEGYVGFQFKNGPNVQYGWARVRTTGLPHNFFIVVDYAWGDPGDTITAGQKEDLQSTALPDSGSLGVLALGAVGLQTWRRHHPLRR